MLVDDQVAVLIWKFDAILIMLSSKATLVLEILAMMEYISRVNM